MNIRRFVFVVLALGALAPLSSLKATAQSTTSRIALVIGEAQYRDGPLATAANDGGLVADLLRQAGYDVTGAANLGQEQIRATFREFLEKAAVAGPNAEVFVYLAGKGLQFAGENYLAPVEAIIANSASVPAEAVRLSDFIGPLEGLPTRERIVVLDLARPNSFGRSGAPLASGLAIVDAPDNTLVASNASPGTIAPDEAGPYGAYAQSLVEMLRQPGLPLNDVFAQVRLRVNQATRGGETPWHVTKLNPSLAMFAPTPGAPRITPPPVLANRRPMREVTPQEAYGYAVERDTFESYTEFLQVYSGDPLARRVRAMLAARREAMIWRRTYLANSPEAYWTYLRRYPRGPHAGDADRRLSSLSAALQPPPRFREFDAYDVPPPPEEEVVIIDRPRFYVNEIVDIPPPRFSEEFLPPVSREYRDLPPPPPPPGIGYLPIPVPIPIPFARPERPAGVVVAPRFVQQPAAQPGVPPPAPPQGYSPSSGPRNGPSPTAPGAPSAPVAPASPAGARPPAAPVGTAPQPLVPVAPATRLAPQTLPTPAPVAPGAPPAARPVPPAGPPPSQALPNAVPTRPAPVEPPATGPRPPAIAPAPSQTLPNPASRPSPVEAPVAVPPRPTPSPPSPAVAPRPTLPPEPKAAPPAAVRPESRPAPARPAAPAELPRPTPPPVVPHAEPSRVEPRPAAPQPVAAPRVEPPHAEPPRPAAPPPHVEPRPAAPPPAPHVEPPRAPPPAAATPRPVAPPPAAPHPPSPGPAAAPHSPGGPGAPHEGGGGRPERRPE